MPLDRRRFLQLTTLGVIATVTDSACASSDDRTGVPADRPQLLGMLGAERVRQLGAHYRAATLGENSVDALRAALSNARGPRIPFVKKKSVDDQIRDDFAADRTVLVDGWVLSLTEARQCGLYSLTPA